MLGDFFGVPLDESGELGDSRLPDFPLRRLSTVQYLIELIQLLGKNQYLLLFLTGHCLRLLLSWPGVASDHLLQLMLLLLHHQHDSAGVT